jgi:replicative DNA helicase
MLSSEARVDMQKIRSGRMQREDWNLLTDAAARMGRLPLWLEMMVRIWVFMLALPGRCWFIHR